MTKSVVSRSRPMREHSYNSCCRLFILCYGDFNRDRESTENLFERSKRSNVQEFRMKLFDLADELVLLESCMFRMMNEH